jgi:hypothetical protein
MKPMLKAPGSNRLKLEYDGLLSNFAFKFKLRRYTMTRFRMEDTLRFLVEESIEVGRCRLTLSNAS